jgi:hypothetical protein
VVIDSVVNDPLRAPGSTLLYLCFPPVWGTAAGDPINPHNSWDQNGNQSQKKKETGPQDLKEKRDSPPRRSLLEILQKGAGSSSAPLRDLAATIEPAAEISAKGIDKPVVINLPEVKPRIPLLGVSSSDIPLQGASSYSNAIVREDLGHLVSEVGGISLAKKALSGAARWKPNKAKAKTSKTRTRGIQQAGNVGAPNQGETLIKTPKVGGQYHYGNGKTSKKEL